MPVYSYRSSTMDGTIVEGAIEAPDEKSAIEKIKDMGVIPLKVTIPRERIKWRIRRKSSTGDLLAFSSELSVLLGAGLPLDRSLNILSEISENRQMKGVIRSVVESIRGGGSFSEAIQQHPDVFPRFYVNMIRAGEAGGVLDIVLDKLNEFLEATKEMKDHVVSAMIYPAILIVTGGLSVIILLTFVLPKFSVIFAELGSALPLPTQILLGFSNALQMTWWIILLILIALGMYFRSQLRTDRGRYRWDAFKLRMMGDVIRKLETARFCRTLGTLLKSGVPLLQSLNNAKDVIGNQAVALPIETVLKGAKEGKGISAPLSAANVFPPLALSMIRVGEETGQLDAMLLRVATAYEKSLKEAVKRFVSFLEPVVILIMGLVIGFIIVSMLMAIFSITDLPF
jgi:general secretion pathway protein F